MTMNRTLAKRAIRMYNKANEDIEKVMPSLRKELSIMTEKSRLYNSFKDEDFECLDKEFKYEEKPEWAAFQKKFTISALSVAIEIKERQVEDNEKAMELNSKKVKLLAAGKDVEQMSEENILAYDI